MVQFLGLIILVYPLFVVILSLISLLVLVVFVLPGFKSLLIDMGGELPLLTKIIIGLGEGLASCWYLPLLAMVSVKPLCYRLKQSKKGAARLDQLVMGIKYIRQEKVMEALRSLGALLRSGVAISKALQTVALAIDNSILSHKFLAVGRAIENGEPLSTALDQEKLLPNELSRIIAVGEGTGQMAEILLGLANYYDKEKEVALKRFTALLEPTLTLMVGLLVALIALSLFWPMTTLLSKLQ